MNKIFNSQNTVSLVFLVLYGGGVLVNAKEGNTLLALVWGVLFSINLGMLLYRVFRKKDEDVKSEE